MESLEHRTLLATLMVTTASDAVGHTGTSLRDAIATANTDAAGGVSDTINFDASLSGATIQLQQGQLVLSGAGGGKISIDGRSLASRLNVSASFPGQVFQVNAGAVEIDGIGVFGGTPNILPGGGIYNAGSLSLVGDVFENNQDGAIYNFNGAVDVSYCIIQGNSTSTGNFAAAIVNKGPLVTVTHSVITGNTGYHGAILNYQSMSISDSTVSSNLATGPFGGGGINNEGALSVWRSTIAFNNATKNGGGIYNGFELSIVDSTVYGNSASDGGAVFDGVGFLSSGAVPAAGLTNSASLHEVTVSSSTIFGNTASVSNGIGGIYIADATCVLLNSIVTGNRKWDLDRSADPRSKNDIIGPDAGLAALGNYGGPTQTMALLPGSPAIDAGRATTSLAAPTIASATTISVGLGAAIARTPGDFLIQIDGEIMRVTNASGNALTVVRGQNGTTAAPHAGGAAVYLGSDQRGNPRIVNGVTDIGAYETAGSPNAIYVASVYQDVLGRAADAAGLASWTYQLDHGRPRGDVAFDLVHSNEYYQNIIITPAYVSYLLRSPDAAGLAFWTDLMKNHGLTDERLEANFIASQEFYTVRGGGTNAGWVDALYLAFLGRPADPAGKAFWLQKLAEGQSRSDIAYGFAAGIERERDRITQDYQHYLGRTPDEAGILFWLQQFQAGVTNENVITGFVASDEYYNKHSF